MAADPLFIDTSLLVAAAVDVHPAHQSAHAFVERVAFEQIPLCISALCIAAGEMVLAACAGRPARERPIAKPDAGLPPSVERVDALAPDVPSEALVLTLGEPRLRNSTLAFEIPLGSSFLTFAGESLEAFAPFHESRLLVVDPREDGPHALALEGLQPRESRRRGSLERLFLFERDGSRSLFVGTPCGSAIAWEQPTARR